ncbi:hypothetical protein [Tenacibaculum sp. nBUS_03]|uniref:hypothetical protein n=1 Tax=Tenacibaculum sp. nBUS_03 TaxID=3395320 RepID=UPI003EC0862B
MMKLYKTLLILISLTPTLLFSNTVNDNNSKKHEKSKTIKKYFSVNRNATLYINNKYGNINVTTWNKNSVQIDIKITVKGNTLDKVENKLNAIKVDFEASKDLVEARTRIEKTKSSWSSWWKSNNINFKINYYIKMPVTNNADFNNKYGNIEIDTLEGKTNINCDYGNIDIDKLTNNDNTINLDYCDASDINFIKAGNISIDYSTLRINNSKKIKINADYSTVRVQNSNTMKFNTDYGSVVVNNIENMYGNSDYTDVKIGTLKKNLDINADYGSVKVQNVANGFEKISIDGSYASIKLGTSSTNDFKFIMNLGYASFNYPSNKVEMFKSIKKSSSKYYEGIFGNTNSNSLISIKSDYGGVSIKIND